MAATMSRRSEPNAITRAPAACGRCGHWFDHGRSGARTCPRCAASDLDDLDAFCEATRPLLREQLEREQLLEAERKDRTP
jgi:predicted Zn-ribbon and HTH transcriptional regulator